MIRVNGRNHHSAHRVYSDPRGQQTTTNPERASMWHVDARSSDERRHAGELPHVAETLARYQQDPAWWLDAAVSAVRLGERSAYDEALAALYELGWRVEPTTPHEWPEDPKFPQTRPGGRRGRAPRAPRE